MRWLLGVGLALLVAGHGGVVHADPGTPQLSPLRRQREDTQRLREQQHVLERERAPAPVAAAAPASSDKLLLAPARRGTNFTGVALLGLAGVTGLLTLSLLAADSSATSEDSSLGAWTAIFGATTAVTGLAGLVLVVSGRSVQVAPTATPKTVGLAISGRM